MTSFDAWSAPTPQSTTGWQQPVLPADPTRRRQDLLRFVQVVAAVVLAGAPVGLLWAQVAPHYTVVFEKGEATYPLIESSKAFVGADGTFALAMVVAGLLTGAVAWLAARRSGPWTVVAVAVGGLLAGLVAMRVGLIPGRHESFEAIARRQGSVELFLGTRDGNTTHLRAPWATLLWPASAAFAFLVAVLVKPESVD